MTALLVITAAALLLYLAAGWLGDWSDDTCEYHVRQALAVGNDEPDPLAAALDEVDGRWQR